MLRRLIAVLAAADIFLGFCRARSLSVVNTIVLGPDPPTVNRLNGESFQQDTLVTFNGYQYALFWVADSANSSVRHASVSRRPLHRGQRSGDWESFILTDYNQTEDDGHDITSLGISRGDGSLHIIFDQHDNPLHYRSSIPSVATHPKKVSWTKDIFGPSEQTQDFLPGLETLDNSTHFINVTYPRFLSIPSSSISSASDLLLEMRVGRSGLGDDWLYRYTPHSNWTVIGKYLEVYNAYINGLDFDSLGRLHATWTYRDFINDTGKDVAVQAGPNGPENNHDLDYSFSPDLGYTWMNNWQQSVGNPAQEIPIQPISAGITIFSIPKFGGILNQEGQTVDKDGRVHVLNRENATGTERWYHYWRSKNTFWTRTALPLNVSSVNNTTGTPTVIGKRGKLVAPPHSNDILAILPSNAPNSTGLTILASSALAHFSDWRVVWEVESGFAWEPLYDRYRLDTSKEAGGDGILSLFYVNGSSVSVIDFDVTGLD
ncbi:hypothetical protein FPV67DRAFT_1506236 [Lyophyllum atratum]|nr:hypothetical protein FPV67DRAFT_1506236 [Lyophyllum atratum]